MPPDIRALAKELNLSITTISRALDGYDDVSKNTRERVVQAARELGYQPSSAARQLRRKRSDSIGYILPTSSPRFFDPFYSTFINGICDEAASYRMELIVSSSPPGSPDEKSLYRRWIDSHRVDGFVLNRARQGDWRIHFLLENRFPFVTLGKMDTVGDYPCIVANESQSFRELVTLMVNKGHRRIAYIGAQSDLIIQQERQKGYLQGLADHRLPLCQELIAGGDLTEQGGYLATLDLLHLADPPTAILACNDLSALGVYKAVKENGMTVGRDIAVSGYDGIKEAEFADPPLTTVIQPTYEIARKLTMTLLDVINKKPMAGITTCVETEIIIRDSTG